MRCWSVQQSWSQTAHSRSIHAGCTFAKTAYALKRALPPYLPNDEGTLLGGVVGCDRGIGPTSPSNARRAQHYQWRGDDLPSRSPRIFNWRRDWRIPNLECPCFALPTAQKAQETRPVTNNGSAPGIGRIIPVSMTA